MRGTPRGSARNLRKKRRGQSRSRREAAAQPAPTPSPQAPAIRPYPSFPHRLSSCGGRRPRSLSGSRWAAHEEARGTCANAAEAEQCPKESRGTSLQPTPTPQAPSFPRTSLPSFLRRQDASQPALEWRGHRTEANPRACASRWRERMGRGAERVSSHAEAGPGATAWGGRERRPPSTVTPRTSPVVPAEAGTSRSLLGSAWAAHEEAEEPAANATERRPVADESAPRRGRGTTPADKGRSR